MVYMGSQQSQHPHSFLQPQEMRKHGGDTHRGRHYIYGTRWTTKKAALGRQPGVAQTDKWVIWKTKDNLWTQRLKNAGFHEVFSTDKATKATSCGFKIKGWWRKKAHPDHTTQAIDLLSLNDSEASLQVIHKWIRCGAKLNLSKTPDADVLKEIVIKLH